jgi:hypothetical protein
MHAWTTKETNQCKNKSKLNKGFHTKSTTSARVQKQMKQHTTTQIAQINK